MYKDKKVGFFVPTNNGASKLKVLLEKVRDAGTLFDEKLAIDSFSTDNTASLLEQNGFFVQKIKKADFTHGLVRKLAIDNLSNCDYVIMVTQDIEPLTTAFVELLAFIENHKKMASAYGRQLVDENRGTIYEVRSREFNYPRKEMVKDKSSIPKLGIKTIFQSDAFAVYNVEVVKELGNFPEEANFAEDQYMAAQAILHGYSVGYAAKAMVYHQHNHTLREEYQRFREIGKFNQKYRQLLAQFGTNEKEGAKFVLGELKYYFFSGNILKIPKFLALSVAKYLGYRSNAR